MIWIILLVFAIAVAVAQHQWAGSALRKLSVESGADRILARPGEKITWSAKVNNHSRLPVLFSRLQLQFPGTTVFEAEPDWIRSHCRQSIHLWHVEEKLSLMPLKSRTGKVTFSMPDRGMYSIGNYRLSAGDLLGFREEAMNGPGGTVVVMPKEAKNKKLVDAVGGFLGDISVRRYILEDPILTVGFRDYTGREPMKSISWTRTATAGSLQVKQFDHTAEQTVIVLLNVEGGTPDQLEGCFRLMRSVCQQLERRKIPYGLRTNGNLPGPVSKLFFLAEGLGSSHLNAILYALGCADYARYHSFRYLTEQTLRHRKKNEAYILITPKVDSQIRSCLRSLETAVGNPVCVLSGDEEVQA